MPRELTYEGLRASLNEAIEQQERILEEMREELEAEVRRTEGACHGEPYFRHMGADYKRAGEYLQTLYGYSEDLAERERRGVPLGDPRTAVFARELLEVLEIGEEGA